MALLLRPLKTTNGVSLHLLLFFVVLDFVRFCLSRLVVNLLCGLLRCEGDELWWVCELLSV
jgi:hypothetical protein